MNEDNGVLIMERKTELIIDDFTTFISELDNRQIAEEDSGINYAEEYRKQTGKDLETGEYTTQ